MTGIMERPQVILIVAPPGDLQAGLQILVAKLRATEVLAVADAQAAIAIIARHQPSLLILDGDAVREEDPAMLGWIKKRWPSILCLVLSSCPEERQAILANGADVVLIKGYPAARLVALVEQLLATGPRCPDPESCQRR